MKKLLAIVALLALVSMPFLATDADAKPLQKCTKWCYDPIKHKATGGYHPQFLKAEKVALKEACKATNNLFGFCKYVK